MKQNKISQMTEQGGSEPQGDTGQSSPDAETVRDSHRLNAEGLAYSGYHVNHDAPSIRRPRATGSLA